MNKILLCTLAGIAALIVASVLAYYTIIWYIDRHPVVKTAAKAVYVDQDALCSSGLDYITNKPYWCSPNILEVSTYSGELKSVSPQVTADYTQGVTWILN